jgi:hypothetical protein
MRGGSWDVPLPSLLARLKSIGVCKVEIQLADASPTRRAPAGGYVLGEVAVTFYFDDPATADPARPVRSQDVRGPAGDTLRQFEDWIRKE